MSNHVLKPVLIGVFVLVVLIAAVALVYSTAPQASEITNSSASPRATTSTGLYYAPASGTVECSDGEDNDGDGLIDWSATADASTIDSECDSARDRSERYSGVQ